MKKWIYVIAPVLMLGIFVLIYSSHSKEVAEKERVAHAKLEAEKKAKEIAKKEIERQAQLDAKKRAAERAAEDKKKEQDKKDRWNADTKKILDARNGYLADAQNLTKKVQALEGEIDKLHKAKEAATREALEMAKTIERGKVDKRTADMEIQRYTEMISRKAAASSLARPPAVAPAPAGS